MIEVETWKPSPLLPDYFRVSDMGGVKTIDHHTARAGEGGKLWLYRGTIRKPCYNPNGYQIVTFYNNGSHKRKTVLLHRAIAFAFLPNPEGKPHINHKNRVTDDNRLNNLEWVTASENQIHSYKTFIDRKRPSWSGASHPSSILTTKDAEDILRLVNIEKRKHRDVAKMFGVGKTTVSYLVAGKSWKHMKSQRPDLFP